MSDNTENLKRFRFTATVDDETYQRVQYWARKNKLTINELLRDAIELYIARQNKDYDLDRKSVV